MKEALNRLNEEKNNTESVKVLRELDNLYENNNLEKIKGKALIYKKAFQEE